MRRRPHTERPRDHRRSPGDHYEDFALVSCFCAGEPAAAIATVTVHPAGENSVEAEYLITPLFVSIVPEMRLTGHDGREP